MLRAAGGIRPHVLAPAIQKTFPAFSRPHVLAPAIQKTFPAFSRSFAAAVPTVRDNTIYVTFTNRNGGISIFEHFTPPPLRFEQLCLRLPDVFNFYNKSCCLQNAGDRLRVPALDGQTLYEVALNNEVVVGDLFTCHVVLAPDSYAAHPPPKSEEELHLDMVHERSPTSRMASFLTLSKAVPETTVALVDVRDFDTP